MEVTIQSGEIWQLTIRILTVIAVLWIMTYVMGKRFMGELPVIDFMIAITVGNIAGADLADLEIPHLPTLIAIVLLGGLHYIISKGLLKFPLINRFVTLAPTIVVQNGQILENNLNKQRLRIDDLIPLLRKQGVFDLNELDYAILEPTGDVSVLKKDEYKTPNKKELNISTSYKGLPLVIIIDGSIEEENLSYINKDKGWVLDAIKKEGFNEISEVFLAVLNEDLTWYISPYNSGENVVRRQIKY